MDALVALGNDRSYSLERRTFRCPIAAGARAVFLSCQHQKRSALFLVEHGGIVYRHHLARGQIGSYATLGIGGQTIPDPGIRECAAYQYLVVATARSIRVEIRQRNSLLDE